MTTFKGIAAVTRTLGYLVGSAARAAVPEVDVTLARPEEPAAGSANSPRLNVYLVQVTPEATMRSNDLPTRTSPDKLVAAPMAPVNLRYLLSFFGTSEKAHLMLGATELVLRERAVLDPTLIEQALVNYPELQDSGLERQVPPVRVVPSLVTLEELSRFWSGFLQMPYTVSTVYEAMTVILTSSSTPAASLPVAQLKRNTGAAMPPRLEPFPPIPFTAHPRPKVPVKGRGLQAGDPVKVGSAWTTLQTSEQGLTFTLPPDTPAGVQTVTLGTLVDGKPQERPGARSETLRIRPDLLAAHAHDRTASITVAPAVERGQHLQLSLVAMEGDASVQLDASPDEQGTEITFTLPYRLPLGRYLALLEVDGVTSLPIRRAGHYAEPILEVK
ncbi:DUF4255 domain-containing protein [Solirubrobacter soli]|uniref:DUF4255 domain-containing protein n=1 Tax=Solirubrobacter soli TaxID=363832 RepID=UPI0003FFEA05|nr:DUF4255 domain-containing protein [Solirubrobacter soli]